MHAFPLVDLASRDSSAFIQGVCDGFRREGFLAVSGHTASIALMDEAEGLTAELFTGWSQKDLEAGYGRPDISRQLGFSPLCAEQAAALQGKRLPADLKTFWMIRDPEMPEDPADAPYGNNVFPDALLPKFAPVMLALIAAYKEVYFSILTALEQGYGLPPGKLVAMARGAETVLRPLFYPSFDRLRDMGITPDPSALRSAPHYDINAFTVLRPRPGLWAKLNGTWVKADASDPTILWINIGEMVAQVEGISDLVPTMHCVGTPPGESDPEGDALLAHDRVSIPLFCHFRQSTFLRPGLRTGDWFRQRIAEIIQM